ncbi:ATP-dependent nuclease [Adlercreutzia sp.]|uniref:ATP-dependent nuclease n=1 Tax=Adlercreutzia sp. TaxID=1872387 RepID=UPI002F92A505
MSSGRNGFDIDHVIISGFKRIRKSLCVNFERDLNILVGDNGAGKSTILEAVHLVLTGQYRGEPIRRALSQALFNNDDVDDFIKRAADGDLSTLPMVRIEVYLSGGNESELNELSGAVNSESRKACGFTFSLAFDEKYREELKELPIGSLRSLPIEYYDASWMTFASAAITPRHLPIRSVMINPAGEWRGGRADERAVRALLDGMDEKEQMALAQSARTMFDAWNAEDSLHAANGTLPSSCFGGIGAIDLVADRGTSESWKRNLVVRLESVPYGHIGAGSQSMMQAGMALDKRRPEKTTLLLFEEPENHLSHANLNRLIHLIKGGADGRKVVMTTHSSYVANVLGLENLRIVSSTEGQTSCSPLTSLDPDTLNYFKKLPGYDTLRLVLATSAVLVEGPSDELVVQLAYRLTHEGKLPIEDGVDVISVGSGFLRFLELADAAQKRVLVLTDNDGKPAALHKKYQNYDMHPSIRVCFVEEVYDPNDPNGVDPDKKLNWNTLEAEIIRKNGMTQVNALLNKTYHDEASLLKYMENNKTEVALKLFDARVPVEIPDYITSGLDWLDSGR